MTLDEAIEHAKKVARTRDDDQCAAYHVQLAEWLRQARGADKAAKWYTAKIRELENRSKALETLISEKDAENAKLRELLTIASDMARDYDGDRRLLRRLVQELYEDQCDEHDRWKYRDRMRELGIKVEE